MKTHYVPFYKQEKHIHHLQQQNLNCIQTIISKPVNGKLACPFYSLYPGASEPKRFYDLNIPLAKCKKNIPAQRILRNCDTYAVKANKGLRLGWQSILRKILVHRCWKVFSALPQCADRDTNWTFSVDTFISTKSTHWQNSNELASRPKVHISSLKVNLARLLMLQDC